MDFLDVPTLLNVSAVFSAMAALVWLMLGHVFRMAPVASRLMAGAHLAHIVSLGCPQCWAGRPAALQRGAVELASLLTVALLVFALRRMLRSRSSPRDVLWLTGAGSAGVLAGLLLGHPAMPSAASAMAVVLLAALAVRDLWRGVGRLLSWPIVACLALPFVALLLMNAGRATGFTLGVGGAVPTLPGQLPPAWRALAWLALTASITLTLMALLIWRLIDRIQHLTRSDPLTGARNRRAFEQALAEAQALLQRGHGFALVMIDVDHFKRVNDRLGHAAGDAALQHCVGIWQAGLRDVDRLGRLGGEEFCVLLPLALPGDLAAAAAVAERLRAALEAAPLHWRGEQLPLTASFGVALPEPGDARGDLGLARADAQLYRAKAEGRNRVCVAAPEGRDP